MNTKKRYKGFFLMDSGLEVKFNISKDDKEFEALDNGEWIFEDSIWVGGKSNIILRSSKIIGWCFYY